MSGQQSFYDLAMDIGEAEISALVAIIKTLMIKPEQAASGPALVVVVNWVEELRQRLGNN